MTNAQNTQTYALYKEEIDPISNKTKFVIEYDDKRMSAPVLWDVLTMFKNKFPNRACWDGGGKLILGC